MGGGNEYKGIGQSKPKLKKRTQRWLPSIITSYNYNGDLKITKAGLAILTCQERKYWRKKLASQSQLLSNGVQMLILLF